MTSKTDLTSATWVTTDNGLTYTQVASFSGTNTTWTQATVNLDAFAGHPSVRIVLQLLSNSSVTGDGWYIDDVAVTGTNDGRVTCHLWDSSKSVPSGFGAAYNVLSSARELLLGALCEQTSAEYRVGNGFNFQYIYNQGYFWTGSNWQMFNYQCQGQTVGGAWCVGNATQTENFTSTQLQQKNSYLAYVCNWTGSAWKCGCRDQTCAQNYWNLQQFVK
jgi:hypothetical protein